MLSKKSLNERSLTKYINKETDCLMAGFALINFIIVLLFYKLSGTSGLFVCMLSMVVLNVQVVITLRFLERPQRWGVS